jgi:peptide/nickel transport system substrate-binding protein
MKRFIVLVLSLSFCLFPGCTAKRPVASREAAKVDVKALLEKAKNFKPSIGKRGGELIVATYGDPKTWNRVVSFDTYSSGLLNIVLKSLLDMDVTTGVIKPCLAESWTHSPDFLTWRMNLRKDVTWSDGVPFTADDVIFTFNDLYYNDSVVTGEREALMVDKKKFKISKIDGHTVQFVLPTTYAVFERTMAGEPILPKHKLESAVRNNTFNSAWSVSTDLREIVGTGPFLLEKYEPGQRVVLKRNERFWQKDAAGNPLPYLDRIIILTVKDKNAMVLKFKNDETDFVEYLSGEDYPMLKPLEKEKNFTLYRMGPRIGEMQLLLNQNPGVNPKTQKPYMDPAKCRWFSDKKFRQALLYTLDRESMVKIVLNGMGEVQNGPMSPASGYFCKGNIKKYPYDPAKAKALLAEEGFADRNGDGFLEDKDGNTVEFVINTNYGNTARENYCKMIRKDFENIGLKVHYNLLEFNTLIDKQLATFDWDAIIMGLSGGDDPYNGSNIWHSYSPHHSWNPSQKVPATAWEKRVDEIYDLAIKEMDRPKRKILYDEWQDSVVENLPYLPLVLSEKIFALRNRFGNVNPTPMGDAFNFDILDFFYNLEEIYIQ